VWGLDATGHFCSDEELRGWLHALNPAVWCGSESGTSGSVAQRVLQDLTDVNITAHREEEHFAEAALTDKEKGKRLLFLFQRDLLPGVSGKILESKSSRDNVLVKPVSWEAKASAWTFISVLNLGMLSYIMLFALNQSTHRQGAWALSFLLWLVVEILMVSSLTVLFTHVLVPSLIMKDVNKIKSKLVDSIRAFNAAVRKNKRDLNYESDEEEAFSTTSFLFVSSRLAKQWADLRESKIIAQFKTPWPKQSYQRESDVSGMYSKKFSALNRSFAILAIFFLSNLMQLPATAQDMVVNVLTTSTVGYTVILHVDLYHIYPLLAVVPFVIACFLVHFLVKSAGAKGHMDALTIAPEDKTEDGAEELTPRKQAGKFAAIVPLSDTIRASSVTYRGLKIDSQDDEDERDSDAEDDAGPLHTPVSAAAPPHKSRRQSLRQGLHLLREMRQRELPHGGAHAHGHSESDDDSHHSCSDDSEDSEDSTEDAPVVVTTPTRKTFHSRMSSVVLQSLKRKEQQLNAAPVEETAKQKFRRLSATIVASLKNKELELDVEEQKEFDDLFREIDAEEAQEESVSAITMTDGGKERTESKLSRGRSDVYNVSRSSIVGNSDWAEDSSYESESAQESGSGSDSNDDSGEDSSGEDGSGSSRSSSEH
jgi:hypothetical protein